MNKYAFTPAPWKVGELVGLDMDERAIESEDGPTVCAVWQISPDFNESESSPVREANARLIAKAPALAVALRRLLNSPDLGFEELEAETLDAMDEAEEALSGLGLQP